MGQYLEAKVIRNSANYPTLFEISFKEASNIFIEKEEPIAKAISNTNYIKDDYKGDWIVIKLPVSIILTSFRFYYNQATRAPGLWRCYGSNDGITFTEILEASNDNPANAITATYYTTNVFYEKILSPITTEYKYISYLCQPLNSNTLSGNCFQFFGH